MKQFNVYNENCPSRKLLQIISDKWVILIINTLARKTYRFNELRREIDGISQKMLTHTLKLLEKNGLIIRKEYNELPLKVEYSLSSLGTSLNCVLYSIAEWSEENMKKILKAQTKYQKDEKE